MRNTERVRHSFYSVTERSTRDASTSNTHRLDQLAVFDQCRLVLDVIARIPSFDLIAHSLKFLDLCFEVKFQFLLLRLVRRSLHLVVYALEVLNAFADLLQRSVDFG